MRCVPVPKQSISALFMVSVITACRVILVSAAKEAALILKTILPAILV